MRMALPQEQPQIAIRPQRRHEPKNFHRPLDRPPAPVVPAPGGMGLQSLITKRTDLVIQLSCGTPPSVAGLKRSEEHTSELQSLMRISYAVFCLKTKNEENTTGLP